MNKEFFKRSAKKCLICENDNYNTLDVHRITPGSQGGKYTRSNTICLCSNCHRKVHANEIIIDKKYNSTTGEVVRYYIDGKEFWKKS